VNDFEKQLQDALKTATSGYRPEDPHLAKQRFMTRFRRRRIAFYSGSVALAGAAVAVAILVVPARLGGGGNPPLPPANELSQRLGAIEVGDSPTGIAYGDDAVWVTNSADGTMNRIGSLSNRIGFTYEVGGAPDDVAIGLGAAWVSDSDAGTVTKIPFGARSGTPLEVGEPGAGLDVAPGAGAVWVVSGGELFKIDPAANTVTPVDIGIEGLTDVAAGQGRVIVAGSTELASIDLSTLDAEPLAELDRSSNRDLQMSEGAVWVADGDAGEVTRYDLETGDASDPVFVGGDFTAIASGEGSIWMISGNDGADGNLTRIDPDTAEIVGGRVSIGGRPVDLTTGAGSVWVVSVDAGIVTRIDPNSLPAE
jgi:streptogramin lyase